MQEMVIHKARELKPATRAAIEAEFGRTLRDDEEISIAARIVGEDYKENGPEAALRQLEKHYQRMDEKTRDIPEQEIAEVLHEAIRSVRPHYKEPGEGYSG